MIEKANYCEQDNECFVIDAGCPFGCGDYINKSEEQKLKKFISIAQLLHPTYLLYKCRCISKPSVAICENKKCVPSVCETGKYYASWECECPKGFISNINNKGMICKESIIEDFDTSGQPCQSDNDCWCQSFDGAKFYNERVPNRCNIEEGKCYTCYYE